MEGKLMYHPGLTKRRFMKRFIFIAFFLCVVFTIYLCIGQTIAYKEAQAELQELELILESIQTENDNLKKEAALLQDNEYIEIQARKHLGMAREGEVLFRVVD
jgi:cell division protein FtsL